MAEEKESIFEAELFLCSQNNLNPYDISKVLRSLIQKVKKLNFEKLNLNTIAYSIHKIFTINDSQINTDILNLCCELEDKSSFYLTERCSFDKILAISIDYRKADCFPLYTAIDDAIFRYIDILIKKRKVLPKSIIYAVVSASLSSKYEYRDIDIDAILSALVAYPQAGEVVELGTLIVKYLQNSTNNQKIYDYITKALEANDPLVSRPGFISDLISPLVQIAPQESSAKAKNVSKIIGKVLSSWPGLIGFGINRYVLSDLLRCVPHQSFALTVFGKLLFTKEDSVISDAFVGLTLYFLLQKGLLNILNENAPTNKDVSLFLRNIMPLLTGTYTQQLSLPAISSITVSEPEVPSNTSLVFKMAQSYSVSQEITSVANINLSPDPYRWEWHSIYKLLFIILPYNEQECQSKAALAFYAKLLECFSSAFFSENNDKAAAIEEALDAFFQLFQMNPNLWTIVEASLSFKKAIEQTISNISKVQPDSKALCWVLFKFMCKMMSQDITVKILKKWGTYEILLLIATNITNVNCAKLILSYLIYAPEPLFAITTYSIFLDSKDTKIVELTVKSLRSHINKPKFGENLFKTVIIPKLKGCEKDLPLFLNLFVDCITHDESCLSISKADAELESFVKEKCRPAYFLLLQEEMYKDEIKWWIEKGNEEYVGAFDSICTCAFDGEITLNEIKKYPTILFPAPPHPFDMLGKSKKSAQILEKFIPEVIQYLSSDVDLKRRGACIALGFYGSSEYTKKAVKTLEIPKLMLTANMSGYVATGELIASLSMFCNTEYTSNVLQSYGWHIFEFGTKRCVLPPLDSLKRKSKCNKISCQSIDEPEKYKNVTCYIRDMTNPLQRGAPREKLKELEKAKSPDLLNPEVAMFAMNIISSYNYRRNDRIFLLSLFKDVPLVEKVECSTKVSVFLKAKNDIEGIIKPQIQ